MSSKIGIVIRREYLERVRKKSFIVTTILMPVIMLALMATPALIAIFSEPTDSKVAVVDESGVIGPRLTNSDNLKLYVTDASIAEARANDSVDAVLFIPENILEPQASLTLYTNGASSMLLENELSGQVDDIIEDIRIKGYSIASLDSIMKSVHSSVALRTIKNESGADERESSTMLSYFLGIVLTMLLYICLLLYGQMVMTSIIEEKNNRVLEIVVSSVKPAQLMLGKICGIGFVAVTQILIWGVLISLMSAFILPALLPETITAEMAAVNAGTVDMASLTTDSEIISALSLLGNVGYIIRLFSLLILFLIGGFMLYSAVFAAIGSAVDNIQDASQMQSVIVIPIIIGIMVAMAAAADPASPLAFWTSLIPFTSPMVMMARIPFGIPGWEIALSLLILYVSFFATVWVAAKIYRIGIFMYGKKPTIKDLIRWARYK